MQIRALVRHRYLARGYDSRCMEPAPHVAGGYMLAATIGEVAVATITIRLDSDLGLLADTLYGNELDHLRKSGTRLCELTEFAIAPRHESVTLMNGLLGLAHLIAVKGHGATDIVIEVNPRHVKHYIRRFGFSQIGEIRHCNRVNAPAILLHRHLKASADWVKGQCHHLSSVIVHHAGRFTGFADPVGCHGTHSVLTMRRAQCLLEASQTG